MQPSSCGALQAVGLHGLCFWAGGWHCRAATALSPCPDHGCCQLLAEAELTATFWGHQVRLTGIRSLIFSRQRL